MLGTKDFLKRKEDGYLDLNIINFEVFLITLFEQCKNKQEMEWLKEMLDTMTIHNYNNVLEYMEKKKNDI
ncbi:MAG: hypothetical protein ACRC7R_02120 [Sarcina sp.]